MDMGTFKIEGKQREVVYVSSKNEIVKVEGGYEVKCPKTGLRFIPQENKVIVCDVLRVFKAPNAPFHAGEMVETVEGLRQIPPLPLAFKCWQFAYVELWFEVEALDCSEVA